MIPVNFDGNGALKPSTLPFGPCPEAVSNRLTFPMIYQGWYCFMPEGAAATIGYQLNMKTNSFVTNRFEFGHWSVVLTNGYRKACHSTTAQT